MTRRGTSTGAPSHPANILRQSVYSTHLHLRIYFKSTRLRLASTSTRLLQVNASTTSVYCCTGTRHGGKFLYAMSRDRQAISSTMPVIQSGSAASGKCAITRISDTELFRDLHQSTYGKFGISSRLAPTSSRQFQVNTPTSINAYASALRVYAVAINATRHALRSGSATAGRCAITSTSKIFRDLRAMGDPAVATSDSGK